MYEDLTSTTRRAILLSLLLGGHRSLEDDESQYGNQDETEVLSGVTHTFVHGYIIHGYFFRGIK